MKRDPSSGTTTEETNAGGSSPNPNDSPKRRRSSRDKQVRHPRNLVPGTTKQNHHAHYSYPDTTTTRAQHNQSLVVGNIGPLQKLHASPNIWTVPNFLSDADIQFFQEHIQKGGFKRSFVDRIDKEGAQSVNYDGEHRNSSFLCFQKRHNTRVASIERRAQELFGVSNNDAIEPLQLVRYRKEEFFGCHHDLGDLDEETGNVSLPPRSAFTKRRIATIFCYINDLPEGAGGETFFPQANGGRGLAVLPKRGRAVIFSNVKLSPNGLSFIPDPCTIHEGRPVTQGIKYGLNIWICED
eukprot:scaffold9062_cov154-Amphora_coffeaeformis.AAC.8